MHIEADDNNLDQTKNDKASAVGLKSKASWDGGNRKVIWEHCACRSGNSVFLFLFSLFLAVNRNFFKPRCNDSASRSSSVFQEHFVLVILWVSPKIHSTQCPIIDGDEMKKKKIKIFNMPHDCHHSIKLTKIHSNEAEIEIHDIIMHIVQCVWLSWDTAWSCVLTFFSYLVVSCKQLLAEYT